MRLLLLDNFDSFTYNLYDYLVQLGASCDVVRNNVPQILQSVPDYEGIVLSPGPKKPADAGIMPQLIAQYIYSKPILGVCLGHQGIGEYFGATVCKARLPVHGKVSPLLHNGHPLFTDVPVGSPVMRYHSLIITHLEKTPLHAIAHTPEGEIMAIAHPTLPIYGVQFHPESILSVHGMRILQNWLYLSQQGLTQS